MSEPQESKKPLDGVNVLDFCWVAVGPMTTKYLGEYGATVVRVESSNVPGHYGAERHLGTVYLV
ncbi:MAG: hypothetical protein CM1200mP27_12120 [Chloroflexota bacterium]|nr:MAG: hypothetical protein CM1200mP27_12120 [Chloroflexota bacterium]